MLLNLPTSTPVAVHRMADSSALARVSRLGRLGEEGYILLAGRKKFLGTGLLSLLRPMARPASGWLSGASSANFVTESRWERFPVAACGGAPSARFVDGGIAERALAGKTMPKMRSGKETFAFFSAMVRAVFGGLSAASSHRFFWGQDSAQGTARGIVDNTDARIAPGWLSMRASGFFSSIEPAAADGYHAPVLPEEVAAWMAAAPGQFIIDGTLGGGGHSELFLQAGARVLGIDRDLEALAHARQRLARFGARFEAREGNFAMLAEAPGLLNGERADGLLLDLGVSSRQLDAAERGFSFMREGPLDMRMGPSSPRSAAEVVNQWSEPELRRIFFEFGEEPRSRRIAEAIVARREKQLFETTTELAGHIEAVIGRSGRIHPATRVFQAIRMAVNEELESLAKTLEAAPRILNPGGRLLVITFHSLEDRMVKRFMRHRSTAFLDDPTWPEPRPNPEHHFRLLSRKAIAPTAAEISQNPRARSAKLRVAQLLEFTS